MLNDENYDPANLLVQVNDSFATDFNRMYIAFHIDPDT